MKIKYEGELRIAVSNLFHVINADGKNELGKKLFLTLNRGITKFLVWYEHGTIIRPGIIFKKIIHKSLLNSSYVSSRAQLAVNKKQEYFSLSDHQLVENLILVFVFYERTKRG